ncbi:hypothetical protein GcM3_153011 [Golovinomyces cichoracearum]|uniref:Uncharacterized protein n=1 Tax=Golovinomyces cichoracearum TaxID=62708 RepID=A0A420HWH4_9PEZI|nr:hypothetical protein GcM3_153011 [Golovinomyces cichoracearum]
MKDVDQLRKEVRSTYLSQKVPESISTLNLKTSDVLEMSGRNATLQPIAELTHSDIPPTRPQTSINTKARTAQISIGKKVYSKEEQKRTSHKDTSQALLKSVEETKVPDASRASAQDIPYALNMKLLSIKLPAHLRLTTAEIMINNFKEGVIQTAGRMV